MPHTYFDMQRLCDATSRVSLILLRPARLSKSEFGVSCIVDFSLLIYIINYMGVKM